MGATFIVTLREAFEAALLLGIVYTYLNKTGCRGYFRYVTLGGALGFVASVCLGMAVTLLSGAFMDLAPDVIGAAVLFIAVGLLTWHGWWMQQHARAMTGDLQRRIDEARRTQRLWIVGLIAFMGVFREGSELVLFLWGLMTQLATAGGTACAFGGVAGLAVAALLGWAVYKGSSKLSLATFFQVTSIFLLFLAAGLFSTGVGRLQGMGVLPVGEPLWDASPILSENGLVGRFLNGLIGYRAQPSAVEVAGYLSYLVVAGLLLFGHKFCTKKCRP